MKTPYTNNMIKLNNWINIFQALWMIVLMALILILSMRLNKLSNQVDAAVSKNISVQTFKVLHEVRLMDDNTKVAKGN